MTVARPQAGIRSYADEEAEVSRLLAEMQVEETVERLWPDYTPNQIARHIRAIHRELGGMTAGWIESIKQRIDKRQRKD